MRGDLLSIVAAALMLASCAGEAPRGPEPALAPDKARLYVYRELNPNRSLLWTKVSLDGQPIGSAGPGTVFYRDVPPGLYRIEVASDQVYPDQFRTVRLAAGSRTFADIQQLPYWGNPSYESQGATFIVRIVDPALGAQQVAHLRLIAN
jgi:hypothetical protein